MRGRLAVAAAVVVAASCRPAPPQGRPPPATPSPSAAAATSPAPASPSPRRAVDAFVAAFMDARGRGDAQAARSFLSPEADRQYAGGEGGLELLVAGWRSWSLVAVREADPSSFEVTVRVVTAAGSFEELLFVGPGEDTAGRDRPLVVRGALRR